MEAVLVEEGVLAEGVVLGDRRQDRLAGDARQGGCLFCVQPLGAVGWHTPMLTKLDGNVTKRDTPNSWVSEAVVNRGSHARASRPNAVLPIRWHRP